MTLPSKKILIGRRDKVDFPDLDLMDVEAKVDTGAYTSALHVSELSPVMKDGKLHVEFTFLHHSHSLTEPVHYVLPVEAYKLIKNSSGDAENRFIVKTKIKLFNKVHRAEFSLADRSAMETPVLLGRKLLNKRFMVDVSQNYLSFELKNKRKGK
ncbi:MAG: ATP-dependent zinc protease [Bacteroidia bacterium]|nr:ATP-dependent zinc protease [Bacteroidia bacterium]